MQTQYSSLYVPNTAFPGKCTHTHMHNQGTKYAFMLIKQLKGTGTHIYSIYITIAIKQMCSILKSCMNTNTTSHFQVLDSIHCELYLVVFFCFAVLSFFYRAEWQLKDMKGPVPMLHLPTFLLPLFLLGLVSRTFLESCVIFLLKHTAAHWGFGPGASNMKNKVVRLWKGGQEYVCICWAGRWSLVRKKLN